MVTACFLAHDEIERIDMVFSAGRNEKLCTMLDMLPFVVTDYNMAQHETELKAIEVVIATWHMPVLSKDEISHYFPSLKAVFYAAGSVRYFAIPYLELGISVISAASVMAVPVAQMTLSLIIQAAKGYVNAEREYRRTNDWKTHFTMTSTYPGLYDKTPIGLLGLGAIGKQVAKLLQPFDVEILVFDPFLSDDTAREYGVRKTSLDEIFSTCDVISNHLANNKETTNMLDYRLFSQMKKTAAFINTGRGAQVVESDLARAMQEEPMRQAVLDVTTAEPYPADGILRSCFNVVILPHIAGFSEREVLSFSDHVIAQVDRYLQGLPLEHPIRLQELAHMA